jgi:hypothetical protein
MMIFPYVNQQEAATETTRLFGTMGHVCDSVGVGVGADQPCRKTFRKTVKQAPNLDRNAGLNEDPRMELMVEN